jgi:site-specific DNA-methyltransferase (adenine-specific)
MQKRYTLHLGDSLEVMKTMESNSVDAVVSDPPYGLTFAGKNWDKGVPNEVYWQEAYRIAKPGAHIIAFGGTRTFHRLTCAIEDAGWDIRDCLVWLYGSGFPKSQNVSKNIDKLLGAEREKVRTPMIQGTPYFHKLGDTRPWIHKALEQGYHEHDSDEPVTDEAKKWDGWGTTLKPAWEPIILARKPFDGSVAANILVNGVGAMNLKACRIGDEVLEQKSSTSSPVFQREVPNFTPERVGRWPANVLLDEDSAIEVDKQSGTSKSIKRQRDGLERRPSLFDLRPNYKIRGHDDFGGASRFFYISKASTSEREEGLEAIESTTERKNSHPTVKPVEIMQYLVRLVTPLNGIVLDPFMGSGTTGCACMKEGMRFVGIDITPEYVDIADRRIKQWMQKNLLGI